MKKAVSTRIRITKTGKVLRRKMAQGHFRANKSGKQIRSKRGGLGIAHAESLKMKSYFGSGLSR